MPLPCLARPYPALCYPVTRCRQSVTHELTAVRVFLFCGFYEYSTWCALKEGLGHIPTYSTFDEEFPIYEKILHAKSFGRKETLYTSGFQIVPPTRYFGLNQLPHYAATLRFVKTLMEIGLPVRLSTCRYAIDASQTIQTIPTLGAFLSLNLLCYLNDSTHFKFFYRNFASCGPGSRSFLRRIFGKQAIDSVAAEEAGLVWLHENQWRYWARLGVDPPYATGIPGIRPGMRCLDFENALCWCHRYVADASKFSWSSFANLPLPTYDPTITDLSDFPAWCENEKDKGSSSSALLKGDYDEAKEKLLVVKNEQGDLEEVYEVEKVVCRLGSYVSRTNNGLFRVRWKGYPPEDDTWERESTLRDGAEEVSWRWPMGCGSPMSLLKSRSMLTMPGVTRLARLGTACVGNHCPDQDRNAMDKARYRGYGRSQERAGVKRCSGTSGMLCDTTYHKRTHMPDYNEPYLVPEWTPLYAF